MSEDQNNNLKNIIDLSGNSSFTTLLSHKAKLKAAAEKIFSQQKQVDDLIKQHIEEYRFFKCGQITGSYSYENRSAYSVGASSPRVLRLATSVRPTVITV